MKKRNIIILTVLLLAACAAGGDGSVAESVADGEEATAVPTPTIPAETPTTWLTADSQTPAVSTTETKPASPTLTMPPTATAQTNAVVPVTVDLSQLTPVTAVASTPQVMPAPGIPDPLVALINKVSQDLARRLNIDVSEVHLVEALPVEWSDSSLGCPQPGMGYLTVITPGYRIILSAQGETYDYHTNEQGSYFVLCGKDGRPAPG